jgi:hypothetical protein
VLAGGVQTWGHERLSLRAFRVDVPRIARPADTVVVLAGDDPPWGWLVPFFPSPVSFVQVAGNFPEGPGYRARLREILHVRPAHFAILRGEHDVRLENIELADELARRLRISTSDRGCRALRWAVDRLRLRARVEPLSGDGSPRCELTERPGDAKDVALEDRREREKVQRVLSAYGLALDADSCRCYRARIGRGLSVYQWCALGERLADASG